MLRGSCLCQGVAFEIDGSVIDLLYCHCSMCRKAHGSAFRARGKVRTSEFRWVRGEALVRYYDSSPGQHRSFCAVCGSNLVTRFDDNPRVLGLALGVLDDDPVNRPICHVHVGSKAPWHEITDTLPRFQDAPTRPVAPAPHDADGRDGSDPATPGPALFRRALRDDVATIVRLLADDTLGSQRESLADPLPRAYLDAFEAIDRDPNNELIVMQHEGEIIGVLQMTYIPYLTHQGSWRALVEGVRIDQRFRGAGHGRRLFEWVIRRAEQRGCTLLQLTSDKRRTDAIRFYESLGFVASHEGFKLKLPRAC